MKMTSYSGLINQNAFESGYQEARILGSGCGGMSGGPVFVHDQESDLDEVKAIVTGGFPECQEGDGIVQIATLIDEDDEARKGIPWEAMEEAIDELL